MTERRINQQPTYQPGKPTNQPTNRQTWGSVGKLYFQQWYHPHAKSRRHFGAAPCMQVIYYMSHFTIYRFRISGSEESCWNIHKIDRYGKSNLSIARLLCNGCSAYQGRRNNPNYPASRLRNWISPVSKRTGGHLKKLDVVWGVSISYPFPHALRPVAAAAAAIPIEGRDHKPAHATDVTQ